ncbi:glutamine amidotransferase [Glaciihabitans sp. INWT7]|uniref:type 1 glutamine amidotransferase n=1 Tax=Glaciihabitans sp. INWT7 TaxID=2596912 RepID=UPI0016245D5F|nr:glutamine amidotransferase [Glaciihabitans sp. INWT7]QNE46948.1 glutamine amidotransferase [Glaciihabitans sp. INWT7]
MSALTIVQLYPDELGVAGDRGNVMALTKRLEHAGHSVTVVAHEVGSVLPTDVDLVVVGNGPLSAMRNIHADLLANADRLRALRESGVPIFAYGSGAELLGHSISLLDGSSLEGLGILPLRATRVASRSVGYVIVNSPFGQVVGFEDNASRWTLDAGAKPFGILEAGTGNGEGSVEGLLDGSAIGTQVGGPVLPLNPLLTDAIIAFVAERRGLPTNSSAGNESLELYATRAREVIISHAKHVFSRI